MFADCDFNEGTALRPLLSDTLVEDLELEILIASMGAGDDYVREVGRSALLDSLYDPDEIHYRQEVLQDCLDHPDVVRQLYDIAVTAVEGKKRIHDTFLERASGVLSSALRSLDLFVGLLRRLRRVAEDSRGLFRSEGLTNLVAGLDADLGDDYFRLIDAQLKALRFRHGVTMSASLGPAGAGADFELVSPLGARRGLKSRLGIGPTTYSFDIDPRDGAATSALAELTEEGMGLVANALAQSVDHITDFFALLRSESAFYLGCVNLHDRLGEVGTPTCLPEPMPSEATGFDAGELYDVCLALTTPGGVVGNDVRAAGVPLLMVTGANSGGKSTFLRSVGIAHLMMQCGMFVGAGRFRAGICAGFFTHFVRSEDASMTSGKLDEELTRMSAIADAVRPRSLVLFNESFAATDERDGSEIARQTIRALLDSGIRVLFVSHLYDLAKSVYDLHGDSALFLRAERNEDGSRTYKLIEGEPLPTSFGGDLYEKVFAGGLGRGRKDGAETQPRP